MPIPAAITPITVTGQFVAPDGSAAVGSVKFTPSISAATPGVVLPIAPLTVDLDDDGALEVILAATDDPDWAAPGWTYLVTEKIRGARDRSYHITVPAASPGGLLDLATIAPVVSPTAVTPYLLASRLGAANGVASLDGAGQVPLSQLGNAPGGGGGGTPSGAVVSETAYGQAAAAGSASAYSRGDHTHGTPALGTTGTAAAAGNHTHAGVYDPAGSAAAAQAASQPLDADLTTIAGLTATTDNMIQAVASAWASRTPAQVKAALALNNVDNTSDANKPVSTATQTALDAKQPLDSDLTTIAGLAATTDNIIQAVAGAWASRTPAQVKAALAIAIADVASLQSTLDGKVDESLLDAKGDLYVASAADTPARLAVGSNGQVLTADSAESAGVKWATPSGGGGTDYKTASKPLSGKWYRAPSFGPVGTNLTMTLNRLYFVPLRLAATTTFDRIGIDVAVAAGATGVCRLGIFQADASGDFPGTLVLDAGTVAVDTTGGKTITISQSLSAGVYWLGVANQTAGTAQLRAVTTYDPLVPYFSGSSMFTGSTAPGGIFANSVSGALAGSPTIVDNDNGPIIGLRAA